MGLFCSFMNSESLVNYFVWNYEYFEKFGGCPPPQEFYHGFMYIAPSSDH